MSTNLPRRIFIDAGYTVCSGKSSGIERVVRNLIENANAFGRAGQIPRPELVVNVNGKFFAPDQSFLNACRSTNRMHSDVVACLPQQYRTVAEFCCNLTGSNLAQRWLLPKPGHLGAFKLIHSAREKLARGKLERTHLPIQPSPGDLFLLPDAYWIHRLRKSVWKAAHDARQQGACIATLIYDLIPITHPQFVGRKRSEAFREYLRDAAMTSDLLLTISKTVAQDMREFLDREPNSEKFCSDKACRAVRAFELGSDLRIAGTDSQVHLRPEVAKALKQSPYLMVSTFDPRKNHAYLLDAFDALWNRGSNYPLCLVGRFGSRCDAIIERIFAAPYARQESLYL